MASKGEHTTLNHKLSQLIEKPYQCIKCDKDFSYHSQLKSHLWKHNSNKFETCSYCKLTFSNKSIKKHQRCCLKQHLVTHSTDKKYQCSQCDEVFKRNSLLVNHLRTHSLNKCNYCGMNLPNKSSLKRHLWIHTYEKHYKCSKCNSYFTSKAYLTRHLRTHTGKKQIKGRQCGYAFSHSGALGCHLRSHANEKPCKYQKCNKGILNEDRNYNSENYQTTSNYLKSKTMISKSIAQKLSDNKEENEYGVSTTTSLFKGVNPKQIQKSYIYDNIVSKRKLRELRMECKTNNTGNIKELEVEVKEEPFDIEKIDFSYSNDLTNEVKKEHMFVHTGIL